MNRECTIHLTSGLQIRIKDIEVVGGWDCYNTKQFIKHIIKRRYVYISDEYSNLKDSTYVMCDAIERITE